MSANATRIVATQRDWQLASSTPTNPCRASSARHTALSVLVKGLPSVIRASVVQGRSTIHTLLPAKHVVATAKSVLRKDRENAIVAAARVDSSWMKHLPVARAVLRVRRATPKDLVSVTDRRSAMTTPTMIQGPTHARTAARTVTRVRLLVPVNAMTTDVILASDSPPNPFANHVHTTV